jgi:hypothetical protein
MTIHISTHHHYHHIKAYAYTSLFCHIDAIEQAKQAQVDDSRAEASEKGEEAVCLDSSEDAEIGVCVPDCSVYLVELSGLEARYLRVWRG